MEETTEYSAGAFPKAYAHDAVRDPGRVLEGIRDFNAWVGNAVPGGMDLDFFCERRRSFLVMEGKPRKGHKVEVSLGQYIALRNLADVERFTVLLVGQPNGKQRKFAVADFSELPRDPKKADGRTPTRGVVFFTDNPVFRLLDVEGLQQYLRSWWEEVS